MLGLQECKTAAEVIENVKAVRDRVKRWAPPPRKVEIVQPEPVAEAIPVVVVPPVAVAPKVIPVDNFVAPQEPQQHCPTIAAIITAVCRRYDVPKIDIASNRRTNKIAFPRQIIMYLARTYTLHSLPFIGQRLGGRDHTTVMHGVRKIAHQRKSDPELDALLSELCEQLGTFVQVGEVAARVVENLEQQRADDPQAD